MFRSGSVYGKHLLTIAVNIMKGLTLGLGIALLFSVFNVKADIFSVAPYKSPSSNSVYIVTSQYSPQPEYQNSSLQSAVVEACIDLNKSSQYGETSNHAYDSDDGISTAWCTYKLTQSNGNVLDGRTTLRFSKSTSNTCPPDGFLGYKYPKDDNGDGQVDRCFNPDTLNDLSQCNDAPQLLGNSGGYQGEICITQPSGGQCGYIANADTSSMRRSSGVSCFEGRQPVDPDSTLPPAAEPGQCLQFGTGFVCNVDRDQVCSNNVCPDNCGTVGVQGGDSQFVCFNDTSTPPDKPTNDNGTQDPDDPGDVQPSDPNNALSQDLSTIANRLGNLISLTRDKGNDVIYAMDRQTGEIVGSARDNRSVLTDISGKISASSDSLVAAVDKTTGDVISVMRESQVKLAELGDNIILTKDIQQGILTASQDAHTEITRGFDNVIEFMQAAEHVDPTTGKSAMETLLETNSDGYAQVQSLLEQLLDAPGVKSPGGSALPTDPETGEELVPDAPDFRADTGAIQAPDHTQIDADIEQAKLNFLNEFNRIRALISDTFSIDLASGGSLPPLGNIEYGGRSTAIDLSPYSEQLSWIGLAMLFICTLGALFIIFR